MHHRFRSNFLLAVLTQDRFKSRWTEPLIPPKELTPLRGMLSGRMAGSGWTPHAARIKLRRPPETERRTFSVSNCLTTRPRLAPKANRSANSRVPAADRARRAGFISPENTRPRFSLRKARRSQVSGRPARLVPQPESFCGKEGVRFLRTRGQQTRVLLVWREQHGCRT